MARSCPRPAGLGLAPLALFALGPTLAGCPSSSPPDPPDLPLAPGATVTELAWVDHPALVGVSGVTLRRPGELWVAPERTGALASVSIGANALGPPRPYPLEGLPEGADVEAIAFVGRDRLLIGTEAHGERLEDPIYVVTATRGRAVVTGALVFDYRRFGVEAAGNQGIEGLCVVPGSAVAASEAVTEEDGRRTALVAHIALPEGEMRPFRVRLRSARGKISALACRQVSEDRIEVHAIERHYGIMRLVRFEVDTDGDASEVEARLVVDLAPALGPEPPNVEGLAWMDERALVAVTDNHYGRKMGPPRAFRIDLGPPGASP